MPYLPNFKAIAEKIVSLGGHVHPVKTGQKALTVPNWQDAATRDLTTIAQWAKDNPHFNCAVVGRMDGLWVADFDDEDILIEYEMACGAINTYRVRSVSNGLHLYFRQNDRSRRMGNLDINDEFGRELMSARVFNRYVLSAGSTAHPHNDPEQPLVAYKALDPKAAVIEAPDEFIDFLEEKHREFSNRPVVRLESGKVREGGRNNYLTARAGSLRGAGANEEEFEPTLQRINEEICEPPLDEDEVHTIAVSIGKTPFKDDIVLVNGKVPGVPDLSEVGNWRKYLRSVNELEQGEIKMLVRNFLPPGIIFIGGLAGEGKTWLALSIAKALTTGRDFLGCDKYPVPEITPVLYLIPEVGGRSFRKRCEKFHIPNDPSLFLCRTISEGSTLGLDDPLILEAVRTMRPVVFLDTLIRFNRSSDENSATQNKMLVDGVIALIQNGAQAVIGLHHSAKVMRKEGISLESVLRGTGDLAACCDAVYGLLRDDTLYAKNTGPNEIDVECAKARDFDAPIPFRIAASRKVDPNVIGIAPGIASNIDQYGDFLITSREGSQEAAGDILISHIKADSSLTIKDLEGATKLQSWQIKSILKARGWFKTRGPGSTWKFSPDLLAGKIVAGRETGNGTKAEDEVEDIAL